MELYYDKKTGEELALVAHSTRGKVLRRFELEDILATDHLGRTRAVGHTVHFDLAPGEHVVQTFDSVMIIETNL